MNKSDLVELDLGSEEWREYDFCDQVYRIASPKKLYYRKEGTTHRVLDASGVLHIVPAPGYHACVVRLKTKK